LDSHGVAEAAALTHEDAVVLGSLEDISKERWVTWLLRFLISDNFDADHQALTSDVTDLIVSRLQLSESLHELLTSQSAVFLHAFFVDDSQGLATGCHCKWICRVRGESELAQAVTDFLRAGNSGEWEAVTNSLGHGDHIWLCSKMLKSPVMASKSTETGLYLVTQVEATSIFDMLRGFVDEAFWHWVDATDTLNWLSHEKCHITWRVEVDGVLDLLCIDLTRLLWLKWATIIVWEASCLDALRLGNVVVPRADVREMLRSTMTMVTVLE